ncbi:hypothetical protein SFSGTM_07260 [Sulfuriferula nivalis]|uniref:Tle cognate immunity protein 4 C-terminal domain-containing protein n=1 Tax=Sulfuriferula nivalis TaxID=2675298 RepID=A0A809S0J1_9PROT|nr:hypothetical protein SFSGTM_07260 [Sulfuriferula nivalis]
MATLSTKNILNSTQNDYQFNDGTNASYSSGYSVFENMDKDSANSFIRKFKLLRDGQTGNPRFVEGLNSHWLSVNDNKHDLDLAWVEPGLFMLYVYRNGRFFSLGSNFDKSNSVKNDENKAIFLVKEKRDSFRFRALYELPNQPGLCVPYQFIPDDGKEDYSLAVTMRLLAHPDVEIMVSFQIADHNGDGNNPKLMHNFLYQRLEEFWGRRNYTGMYKKIKTSSTQSIMLDGREGAGIFANYQNYTKADTLPPNAYGHRIYNSREDFGLYASAEGEEGNPAKPTITVYVIRTADRAIGKPVTETELKAMAETIMASIKPMTPK